MQLAGRQESQSALRANALLFGILLDIGTGKNEAEIRMRMAVPGKEEPFGVGRLAKGKGRNIAALDYVPGRFCNRTDRESFLKRYTRSIHRLVTCARVAYRIGRGRERKVSVAVHKILYARR